MGNPRDFYEVLNIPRDSSSQQIRGAYKTLVKKWHPDKHPPSSKPEAEARFKAIAQAYEALHDRERGAMFGLFSGADGGGGGGQGGSNRGRSTPPLSPGAGPGPAPRFRSEELGRNSKDLQYTASSTKPVFGSYSGSGRWRPPPVERKLECTLEELFHGCKKNICFNRDVVVNGVVVPKEETQTIKVKPGWKKGTKITFEGMGDERPGCLPSDVVYLIAEKEHPFFKRAGNDLVLKVEVPLVNALTGWTFSFRLIGGQKMNISILDEIISPGYEKVVKGQGMPLANEKGVRGDLRIKFHIRFPKQLSKEQRIEIVEVLKES